MTDGLVTITVVSSLILLLALRWAHRCWGKAIMATVFAPLVIVPLGFVAFLAIAFVLRGLNGVLVYFDAGFSTSAVGTTAAVLTISFTIGLLIYYCRDLRSTAGPMKGPWLGTRYTVADPKLNQKGRLR